MNLEIFSNSNLQKISSEKREEFLNELSTILTNRALRAENFEEEIKSIISDLKQVSHELYMFDSDGEFQLWCGDWTKEKNDTELIIRFHPVDGVEASWSNVTDE